MADAVAQSYFLALHKEVPDEPEQPVLYGIPLNRSERILLLHAERLNEQLCQLARAKRWHACQILWDQAIKLAATFSEVALMYPEPFKNKARWALAMPSLRVPPQFRKMNNTKGKWVDPFVSESAEIAEAIELSANTIGAKISDNRVRLGGLCARLVGECVHEIRRARELWSAFFTPYKKPVIWPVEREIQPFLGKTVDELISGIRPPSRDRTRTTADYLRSFCLLADCGWERLHFLLLAELTRESARFWWKNAIEKMVEANSKCCCHSRYGFGS
jgi:hypothetical protein